MRKNSIRVIFGLSLLIGLAATAGFFGSAAWFVDLLSHFRLQYLLALGGGVALLLGLGAYGKAAVIAVPFLLNAVAVGPTVWPQPAADADAPSLRVLTVNVRASNAQYDAIVALIEDKDPDLLLIVELTNGLEAALRPLTARYPYQITSERRDVFGIGLYSKTALDSAEIHPLRASTFPLIQAQTTVSGQPITIFGAHPVPPFGGHGTRMRDADIAELGELVNAVDGPIIVMGDLNASVWSRPLRQLLATTRLQDGGRGFGMQPTWPSGSVLFGIPIDHVLVSAEFDVLTRTVGPAIGSDHQPVTADLRLIAP